MCVCVCVCVCGGGGVLLILKESLLLSTQSSSLGVSYCQLLRKLLKPLLSWPLLTGKKAKQNLQYESCELSYIWGRIRTVVQEMALQITLRNCSKKAWGGGGESVYM